MTTYCFRAGINVKRGRQGKRHAGPTQAKAETRAPASPIAHGTEDTASPLEKLALCEIVPGSRLPFCMRGEHSLSNTNIASQHG